MASGLRGRGGGGFPTGIKWQSCRRPRARSIRHLQRRRGRPRRVHGPQPHGRQPPQRHRGDDHRRLCHRRARRIYLRPQRIPAGRPNLSKAIDRPGNAACWARTSSAPASISTSGSAGAAARLSAANQPRSWPRSRAKPASRGEIHPHRRARPLEPAP